MKKLSFAIVGAAMLALAACGGRQEDGSGENIVEENAATENLEAMADNTANAMETEVLENQASAPETEGGRTQETVRDIDVDAAAVNAM